MLQGWATKEDMMTHPPIFVGIDVSKAQLDLALRPEGRFAAPNTETGIAQALKRLRALSPTLVVMEATGELELPLTGALAAVGLPVVVVNPRQVRNFAKATEKLAKTDVLDAQVLAHFAEVIQPEPRPLPDDQTQMLAALLARPPTTRRDADGGEEPARERAYADPQESASPYHLARTGVGAG